MSGLQTLKDLLELTKKYEGGSVKGEEGRTRGLLA